MAEPLKMFNVRTLSKIKKTVESLSKDDSINAKVKYRKFKETTSFNPENQSISSAYTDYYELEMVKGNFSDREVLLSGGRLELGDVRFLIGKDQFSGTPRTKDILVESGVSYSIMDVWTDPLDISYVFQGREV